MKKIIKTVDKERKIIQVTIADERWYIKETETGDPPTIVREFVPSVTWVCSYYYMSPYLVQWIAKQGYDESEGIKRAAGDKGSKVHAAIVDLLSGNKVKMDAGYLNHTSGLIEELTLEEYECIKSFSDWFNEVKPKILGIEFVVWGDGYAGTVDLLVEINGERWLIDNKTSKTLSPSHVLQVSAYKHALPPVLCKFCEQPLDDKECLKKAIVHEKQPEVKLAILQLGYGLNKKGFKFTEVDDKFDLFLSTKQIWQEEAGKVEPKVKDYPEELSLNIVKES